MVAFLLHLNLALCCINCLQNYIQALLKKLGENQWAALSEKERQKRIMQIKQREKKLRRQGKHDELAKLFENLAVTEQGIRFERLLLQKESCFCG